jgi:hypothetical protein
MIKQSAGDGLLTGEHIAWANEAREMRSLLARPVQVNPRHPFDTILVHAPPDRVKIMTPLSQALEPHHGDEAWPSALELASKP